MAVGNYVVTQADGTTVVGGPYRWDPVASPGWVAPEVSANPGAGYQVLTETPARRNTGTFSVTEANRATITARAGQALTVNQTFLAIGTPTAAQVSTQVQRLTRECSGLLRLLLNALDDVSDT